MMATCCCVSFFTAYLLLSLPVPSPSFFLLLLFGVSFRFSFFLTLAWLLPTQREACLFTPYPSSFSSRDIDAQVETATTTFSHQSLTGSTVACCGFFCSRWHTLRIHLQRRTPPRLCIASHRIALSFHPSTKQFSPKLIMPQYVGGIGSPM